MDDFIFPEDIGEENIDNMDLDADGNEIIVSGKDDQELGGKTESVLSVGQCAQAMGDTLQKYEEVKKRVAEVDQLAMQLSFGMRLQAEMDKCASERRNFPLQIFLKRQKLSSGASLLMIQLRNNSPFEMIEWHLSLTTSSYQMATNAEEKDKIFTKIIPIKQLSQHSEFTYEVFCTHNLPISLFFRVHLLKCIHISGNREPRAFRIDLEPIYLTHWDTVTITAVPESIISRVVQYERIDEEQKITLPDALVYLICGEKQTETTLLNWIIKIPTDECDSANCVVLDDENIRWPFSIEVKKRGLNYDVVLKMKNAKMRYTLINELQIRILLTLSTFHVSSEKLIVYLIYCYLKKETESFCRYLLLKMVRKLKFHEKKLLKKVDFISWELDNNIHEAKILQRYHIKKRQHYSMYNMLAANIREIALMLKELPLNDPFRLKTVREFLEKLYAMGLIPTADTLERASKVSASSFCRRRLPVVMKRLEMAETVRNASDLVEQGHVRVGIELVTDPAFLVTRNLQDCITWTKDSKIRKHILNYNNERDDFLL
uniref:U3 small nucleolar ribonucleoprotein protein IMP3 n=2 Tax=Onchocerca TaxID=6281 RepID=A0A8R1XQB3_ONCVO